MPERSRDFLATLQSSPVDAVISIDRAGKILLFNPGAERIFGYSAEEVLGGSLSTLIPERFHGAHDGHVRAFASGSASVREMHSRQAVFGRRKSGEEFSAEASLYRHTLADETVFTTVLHDVSERAWRDDLLERLETAITSAGFGVFEFDHEKEHVALSEIAAGILGREQGNGQVPSVLSADSVAGEEWFGRVIAETLDPANKGKAQLEIQRTAPGGGAEWIYVTAQTLFAGEPIACAPRLTVGVIRDVSERKAREARQAFLLELSDGLQAARAPDAILESACQALAEHLKANRVIFCDIIGDEFTLKADYSIGVEPLPPSGKVSGFGTAFVPAYHRGETIVVYDSGRDPRLSEPERAAMRAARIGAFIGLMLVRKDEIVGSFGVHCANPRQWTKGDVELVNEVARRVWAALEQARAERALTQSEARYRAAFESSTVGFCEVNLDDGAIVGVNASLLRMTGYEAGQLLGRPFQILLPPADASDKAGIPWRELSGTEAEYRAEHHCARADATTFWADVTINVVKTPDAATTYGIALLQDITDSVRSREDLTAVNAELEARVQDRTRALQNEMRQREQAQAALARSQRLEAIGRLTGGIAHDANNMLTVIGGNLELVEDTLAPDHPAARYLREALASVGKMSQLNRRMLTFARQRRLEAQQLDLNEHIATMAEMLCRVLGERIVLSTSLDPNLCNVAIDASELDNAILNLAINARDAMPNGGRLHISTRHVVIDSEAAASEDGLQAGSYAVIAVTDNGEGIAPEALPHIFEPFFTTKAPGLGTGLGLATLYGFAKQSGGHADVFSEPGRGTTINLYFPCRTGTGATPSARAAETVPRGQGEGILVVEDDPQVRALTLERVRKLGYEPHEAVDGRSALALLEQGQFDLVFSDIVLGAGMSGFELADATQARWPAQRVLLTSGFDMAAERNGFSRFKDRVLQKPYSQAELAHALRAALQA